MEPKFQTSFIPKKPIMPVGGAASGVGLNVPRRKHTGASLFMTLSTILFIASLTGVAGAYLWKNILNAAQTTYKQQLDTRVKQFNPDLIDSLKRANVKIDTAKQLLNNHIAMSKIFGIIGSLTIENVRFTSLNVTTSSANQSSGNPVSSGNASSNGISVTMKGLGANLSAVAFQSDVLGRLDQYGLRNIVKNPILSDPSTDATNGSVAFGFSATIDPGSLSYEKAVSTAASSSNASASAPSIPLGNDNQ